MVAGLIAGVAATARAQDAATNPCQQVTCAIVFDWGGGRSAPDIDRIYGSPADMESAFMARLTEAGFHIATGTAPMTITLRLTPQDRVLCDALPGVNPDYSCHTVGRGTVVFVANDSTAKAPARVDIIPRCSDPKIMPTFRQFGAYAAETVIYAVVNQGKGSRPQVKCR
jgi:hypothetical protein